MEQTSRAKIYGIFHEAQIMKVKKLFGKPLHLPNLWPDTDRYILDSTSLSWAGLLTMASGWPSRKHDLPLQTLKASYVGSHNFYDGLGISSFSLELFLISRWFLELSQVQESLYHKFTPNTMAFYTLSHTNHHKAPFDAWMVAIVVSNFIQW